MKSKRRNIRLNWSSIYFNWVFLCEPTILRMPFALFVRKGDFFFKFSNNIGYKNYVLNICFFISSLVTCAIFSPFCVGNLQLTFKKIKLQNKKLGRKIQFFFNTSNYFSKMLYALPHQSFKIAEGR